jgi:hypothetical protein
MKLVKLPVIGIADDQEIWVNPDAIVMARQIYMHGQLESTNVTLREQQQPLYIKSTIVDLLTMIKAAENL